MLVAHAAYKALLFLSAGSVMHGMRGETDLKRMGGLWRRMPWTAAAATAGAISLAGVFGLAGYFAEGEILSVARGTGRLGRVGPRPARGGLLVTWLTYASGRVDWLALRVRAASLQRFLHRGMYVDDLYARVLVAPAKAGSAFLASVVDARVVDGLVNGFGGGGPWRAGG